MDNQTIIVKKIKKGGHGHHGGAWKVAFADFVTAMMAFFLLLWLLASTTPEEKGGISEYFNPTISGPSKGAGNSDSMIDLGGVNSTPKGKEGEDFKESSGVTPTAAQINETLQQEKQRLESLMEELKKAIEQSQALQPFKDQLLLDITPEGLRIQIVDKENRPMFDSGSAELKYYTKEILHELAKTINTVPNRISLTGHTDAALFVGRAGYSNWELSADRANASRRELVVGGLSEAKVIRVVGLSSIVPFNKDDPRHPINRRIAIIVMNKATEAALLGEGARVSTAHEAEQAMNGDTPVASVTEPPQEAPQAVVQAAVIEPSKQPAKETPKAVPPAAVQEAPKAEPPKKESKSLIGSVKINRQSPKVELAPEQEVKEGDISPIQAINPIQLPLP
jgi:chemotaxis protein MotB